VTTDSVKKACIFCNGQLSNPAKAKQIATDCDLLIAADGGAKHFSDIGSLLKSLLVIWTLLAPIYMEE
jgi:thiamine pyrophosphokinase